MRPAISDSLISGQPLYLLYSKRNALPAVPALIAASLPMHATGSVRLQVTGKPPTTRGSAACVPFPPPEQPYRLSGSAAAPADCRIWRRVNMVELTMGAAGRGPGRVLSARERIRAGHSLR